MKRKSQMKIMEMSFMIIAVTVLFLLMAMFWLMISMGNLKEVVSDTKREGAITRILMIAGSPEFSCAESSDYCVDTDKILALKNRTRYRGFWQVDGLVVQKVYPAENRTIECNIVNYPRCNTYTLVPATSGNLIQDASYVSLCRSEQKEGQYYMKCELGKIIVYSSRTI